MNIEEFVFSTNLVDELWGACVNEANEVLAYIERLSVDRSVQQDHPSITLGSGDNARVVWPGVITTFVVMRGAHEVLRVPMDVRSSISEGDNVHIENLTVGFDNFSNTTAEDLLDVVLGNGIGRAEPDFSAPEEKPVMYEERHRNIRIRR